MAVQRDIDIIRRHPYNSSIFDDEIQRNYMRKPKNNLFILLMLLILGACSPITGCYLNYEDTKVIQKNEN